MMGPTHRLTGATAFIAVAPVGMSLLELAAGTATSWLCSAGKTSPDVDQIRGTGRVLSRLPFRLGPRLASRFRLAVRGHRGRTHYVETALGIGIGAVSVSGPYGLGCIGLGVLVGWLSHVLGDMPFGRVPCLTWHVLKHYVVGTRRAPARDTYGRAIVTRIGWSLKTDGKVERWLIRPGLTLALPVVTILKFVG